MTTDTSAEGRVGSRWAGIARTTLAIGILAAGLWAVVLIALWYGADNLFVSGARLKDPSAVRLPAFVAGCVLVGGVVLLVMRRRFRGAAGLVGLGCLTAVGVAAAGLAVSAYPPIVAAKVISVDPDTRYLQWTARVPLTQVDGVLTDTDGRITVYGTSMEHGCASTFALVTLDRSTGRVIEVVRSESVQGLSAVSVADRTLEAHGLISERGEAPYICLN